MKTKLLAVGLAACMLMTACSTTEKVESYNIGTGTHQCLAAVGDNLLSATGTNVHLYDVNGELLLEKQVDLNYPQISENADNAVVYDIGGTAIIFADGSEIKQSDVILSADLNSSGYFTVCTERNGYKGAVTVYSPEKTELYEWCSADNWIMSAATSADGEYLAVLLSGENGSSVKLFALSSENEFGSFESSGVLINNICWLDGKVCCIADDGLYFINENGKLKDEYSFDGLKLGSFAVCENELIIDLRNHSFGGAGTLIAVNSDAEEISSADPSEEIEWLDWSDGKLLALTQSKVLIYDSSLKLLSEKEQSGSETAFLRTKDIILLSGGAVNVTDVK